MPYPRRVARGGMNPARKADILRRVAIRPASTAPPTRTAHGTMPIRTSPPLWVWGWLLLTVGMLTLRTAIPIDETRYLSVAWEMWWRHSQWVPYLNGHTYDGKPPLLFWLMELGWLVFGVQA